jgi:dGTPase
VALSGRSPPSLEAQICNLADEIAYNNHDVDDGLRSGVLTLEQLQEVSLFARHAAEVDIEFPGIAGRRRVHETIRRMIDAQVTDLLAESARRIAEAEPASLDDVHRAPELIGFTAGDARRESRAEGLPARASLPPLRGAAHDRQGPSRDPVTCLALSSPIRACCRPSTKPWQPQGSIERTTADYIAGMTDRYSMKEHRRLFAVSDF